MDVHTHAHTSQTHRERFAITFWKGKNSSKGLNFNKKVKQKPQKVLTVASFEGDEKA